MNRLVWKSDKQKKRAQAFYDSARYDIRKANARELRADRRHKWRLSVGRVRDNGSWIFPPTKIKFTSRKKAMAMAEKYAHRWLRTKGVDLSLIETGTAYAIYPCTRKGIIWLRKRARSNPPAIWVCAVLTLDKDQYHLTAQAAIDDQVLVIVNHYPTNH